MAAQVTAMQALQTELERLNRTPGLSATVDKVDKIIEMLTSVKDQIVQSGMLMASHSPSLGVDADGVTQAWTNMSPAWPSQKLRTPSSRLSKR